MIASLYVWHNEAREEKIDNLNEIIAAETGLVEPTVTYYHAADPYEVTWQVYDSKYGNRITGKCYWQGIDRKYDISVVKIGCVQPPPSNPSPVQISKTVTPDYKEIPAIIRQVNNTVIYSIPEEAGFAEIPLNCSI